MEILLVLIVAIFILNAILTARRKAIRDKQRSTIPTYENQQASTYPTEMKEWEEWFSDDSDSLKEPAKSVHTISENLYPEMNKRGPIMAEKRKIIRNIKTSSSNQPEKDSGKISIRTREDARKAIIYSEIIKRKY